MLDRRGLITGLISLVAAPAIVRATSLMPVKRIPIAIDNIFVDGNVDFIGDGSLLRPFKTLQMAMDYVGRDLDLNGTFLTINIAAGEYEGAALPPAHFASLLLRGTGSDTKITTPLDLSGLKHSIIEFAKIK